MGPQYVTFFISSFWNVEIWAGALIIEKFVHYCSCV